MFKLGKYKFKQCKQQVLEIAFILMLVLSISVTLIVAAYVYQKVGAEIAKPEINMGSTDAVTAYGKFAPAFSLFDTAMAFIIIGLTLGLLYTSFLIPTHPAFIVVNIVGFVVLVTISGIYSNVYFDIANSSAEFANVSALYYAKTSWIMHELPRLAAGLVFIVSIVMYGKARTEGQY